MTQHRECLRIILHLDAPHGLLVRDREEGEQLHAFALSMLAASNPFIRSDNETPANA